MPYKFNKIYSVSIELGEFFLLNEKGFEQTIKLTEGQFNSLMIW